MLCFANAYNGKDDKICPRPSQVFGLNHIHCYSSYVVTLSLQVEGAPHKHHLPYVFNEVLCLEYFRCLFSVVSKHFTGILDPLIS